MKPFERLGNEIESREMQKQSKGVDKNLMIRLRSLNSLQILTIKVFIWLAIILNAAFLIYDGLLLGFYLGSDVVWHEMAIAMLICLCGGYFLRMLRKV